MSLDTAGMILVGATLLVSPMMIHYLIKTGKRNDPVCVAALLAAQIVLYQAGRGAEATRDLFSVAAPGVTLILIAIVGWWEGLRRFRNPH